MNQSGNGRAGEQLFREFDWIKKWEKSRQRNLGSVSWNQSGESKDNDSQIIRFKWHLGMHFLNSM